MSQIWNLLLFQPLVNGLVFLYKIFGNLGVAIIILTLLLRLIMIPLTMPSLKASKKMAEIAPEIEKLKERHKNDKQKFAQAQMELYRQRGVNPAAGCLPQIIQLLILIALYQAFAQVLRANGVEIISKLNEILYPALRLPSETRINLSFLYLDLSKPDVFHFSGVPIPGIFLILAALTQFLSSKMMQPAIRKQEVKARKTQEKTDDLATSMQSQMLYLFPLMTILIGFTFPSGLILYWFIFSAFQLIQQYFTSGWGGLSPWVAKLKIKN